MAEKSRNVKENNWNCNVYTCLFQKIFRKIKQKDFQVKKKRDQATKFLVYEKRYLYNNW